MLLTNDDDDYTPSGRTGEAPVLENYTIVMACGHKLEYQTYPSLAPRAGDVIICYEHGQRTTVIRLE